MKELDRKIMEVLAKLTKMMCDDLKDPDKPAKMLSIWIPALCSSLTVLVDRFIKHEERISTMKKITDNLTKSMECLENEEAHD